MIAESYEVIHRDYMSGEILCGGNTFVDVDYCDSAIDAMVSEINALMSTIEHRGTAVTYRGIRIYQTCNTKDQYWYAEGKGVNVHAWGQRFTARQVAIHILNGDGLQPCKKHTDCAAHEALGFACAESTYNQLACDAEPANDMYTENAQESFLAWIGA